jgi:hypothetical protein
LLNYRTFLALAAATILISSTLVPVGFMQKAEAATINITTDTTWTRMTIGPADVVNISGATLTITSSVVNFGTINVNNGGNLIVSQPGATLDVYHTLNINSGGNVFVHTNGQIRVYDSTTNPIGNTLNVNNGGTLNVNNGGLLFFLASSLNVIGGTLNVIGGTLNVVQNGKLNVNGAVNIINGGTLNVGVISYNVGGTLNVNGGTLNVYQNGILNVNPSSILFIEGNLIVKDGGRVNVLSAGALSIKLNGRLIIQQSGVVNVEGNSNLNVNSGGFIYQDPGGTLNVNKQGTLVVFNGGGIVLNGGPNGPLNIFLGGLLRLGGSLQLVNGDDVLNIEPGGTLDFFSTGSLGVGGTINHSGTLNVANVVYISGTLKDKAGATTNVNSGGLFRVGAGGKLILNSINTFNINPGGTLTIESGGVVDIFGKLVLKTGGTLSNQGTINKQCGGIFIREPGSTFTGNPIKDLCIIPGPTYPITHMSDTTASSGSKIFKGGNTIIGERVTSTSQLKGDKIDQITIKLRKFGTPTGNAIIGIFSPTGVLKKQFAAKDVSTLTTGFKDYTFKLSGGALYAIVFGDRIGIKYAAGSSANCISVMRDTNPADPFDGTKTDIQQFKAGMWSGTNTNDMYMILKQTHG